MAWSWRLVLAVVHRLFRSFIESGSWRWSPTRYVSAQSRCLFAYHIKWLALIHHGRRRLVTSLFCAGTFGCSFSHILLPQLVQLSPQLLLVSQLLVSNLLLLQVLPVLRLLHLLHEISLIVVFSFFSCIEFLLCDILKGIARLHMYDLFSPWRV